MKFVLPLLTLHTFLLLFFASELSIHYRESMIVYEQSDLLHWLVNGSLALFGQHDLALRLPMIMLHIISALLLFNLAKYYVRKDKDRYYVLLFYLLIPGVNSAALLVNEAGLVITLLLLFLNLYHTNQKYALWLLPLLLFVDAAFSILFFALIFHGVRQRNNQMIIFGLALFGISMYLFGYASSGRPSNHFLETLGVYAAILSPFLFLYFFYVLYRMFVKSERSILWCVSFVALLFSLLLSFRQQIIFEMFAPYVVIAIPLVISMFFHGLRVRLPQFKRKYRIYAYTIVITVAVSTLSIYLNKYLYTLFPTTKKHFAYDHYMAKELAAQLHEKKIDVLNIPSLKLRKRLKFYNINHLDESKRYLTSKQIDESSEKVTIRYIDREVSTFYVSKLNKSH
jgi:hypothetical protein